ncbi:MAG: alpha-amylase family glycosyl hydrolase [Cyclobacteriaceae bacterium]|nr:alpha-amylase family glycosyl hydrolase [Cyclobacteriaceae bacterium]
MRMPATMIIPPTLPNGHNAVMYEIFVQSFADSNGDGIGDIRGMTAKLDYLQDLGIQGIWLMPIMPSPSYHKYDVTDYYGIHPDYGTMDDFKVFVSEAHKRNIKVVIDMIINHTSNEHPWFLDAVKSAKSPYRDYYIWETEEEILSTGSLDKAESGDSGNLTQWHDVRGNEEKFYGFFSGYMPDLNYDNPEVREEMIQIGKFWLQDIGVDGFRLDAAKHIYEDSRRDDNKNWWIEYRHELEKIKPDVYLVGEIWDKTENITPFLHGLGALFNFDLAFSILESVRNEKSVTAYIHGPSWTIDENRNFTKGYLDNQALFQRENQEFYDAIFLSNHDQNRIMSALDGDMAKAKLAASILLTLPGTPYLYYGEEIGMLGRKPDPNIREPFLWAESLADSLRPKWIKPEFTHDSSVTPLSIQMADEESLFNHYKTLIHLRNYSKALTFGDLQEAGYGNSSAISYYRNHGEERLLVIHNLTNTPISIQLRDEDTDFTSVIYSNNPDGDRPENGSVDIVANSTIILKAAE